VYITEEGDTEGSGDRQTQSRVPRNPRPTRVSAQRKLSTPIHSRGAVARVDLARTTAGSVLVLLTIAVSRRHLLLTIAVSRRHLIFIVACFSLLPHLTVA
jgi:hypothetical protein